jgi:hypothetical protein
VFDSNAPATFLATSTLRALGLEAWQIGGGAILLNGRRTSNILVSERQFNGLNIFGMDFLDLAEATLTVDMATNTCCIDSSLLRKNVSKSPDFT